MKPELKAMILAADDTGEGYITKDQIQAMFLAALHWRGDELWCGPFEVGGVTRASTPGQPGVTRGYFGWLNPEEKLNFFHPGKEHTCAALEAAAQEQIKSWFKE